MDGGSRVAEVLRAHGVQHIFTLIGGHISPILVSCKRRGIRVVDVRHEVNTVFAADAMARLTGVPGVAAVTAGPGVTNTLTAIKNAQLAQSPLVLIGGATATMLRGRGSLQDIDQLALMAPHVKWMARPNTLREVIPALEKAFEVCQEGVPGPVFVELAVDLLYPEETVREWTSKQTDKKHKSIKDRVVSTYIKSKLAYQFALSDYPSIKAPPPVEILRADPAELQKAADLVAKAERPVLVIGSQAMLRPQKVEALAAAVEALGLPVYLSGMARGLMGQGHRLQMRHKRSAALKESDVAIFAGVTNDFRMNYGGHVSRATLISANLSQSDLTRNRKPQLGVLADPCTFLIELADAVGGRGGTRQAWIAKLAARNDARDAEILTMGDEETAHINPLRLCQGIEAHLSDHSLLIGDGGDFVATASYIVSPRGPLTWLDPGVFGTLGVGAGFAMGAKLVHPEADVWLLYGDGAAGFSIMEFDSMARQNIPVIAVVGNDAGWTQIERDQVAILEDDVACRLTHMDYHVVAEGCGAKGLLLDDPDKIDEVLTEALRLSRAGHPVLVNALIGKTDFRKGSISM